MPEFLKARLSELADSVWRPIWEWVLNRSWFVRALLLALMVAAAAAWYWPEQRSAAYDRATISFRRIFWGEERLPLSSAASELNRKTIKRLSEAVRHDLGDIEMLTPWSASQAVLALRKAGRDVPSVDGFVDFARAQVRPGCFCWTELQGDPPEAVHLALSGWMMAAHASVGRALSADELRSVLRLQSREGWWPTFPDVVGDEGASTYATAWIALGFIELDRKQLIGNEDKAAVDIAIARATRWLMMARNPGGGWKDYPRLRRGVTSPAMSAFVIHVLHEAGSEDLQEIDRAWLRSLPRADESGVPELERRYQELRTTRGIRVDHLTQVPIAWLIVGTTDAYPNGSPEERLSALRWLQDLSRQERIVAADIHPNNWWRAELLYALAHLQSRLG